MVGHVDPDQGIWRSALNLPIRQPVPLARVISNQLRVPVFLDNDVNAAALAEMQWGVGQCVGDFIYINVGTGIAMGLISNRVLVRGATNYAGELGHMFFLARN